MAFPKIRSIKFVRRPESEEFGSADIQVCFEDGKYSSFVAATPDVAARWMRERGWNFCHGTPVLYVNRLDDDSVRRAVEAMAGEMGGYWLRYFNSLGDLSEGAAPTRQTPGDRRGLGP